MTHILNGHWESLGITWGAVKNDEKGPLDLVIDEGTGALLAGSTQNGHPLTGTVTKSGNFLTVDIVNAADKRRYEGDCSVLHAPHGGKELSITGRVTLDFIQPHSLGDETSSKPEHRGKADEQSARFDQEQAIWVAHKP